jgi:hypothetical protein
LLERKFEQRFPVHQNAVDIIGDRRASKIGEVYPGVTAGQMPMFKEDRRPSIAAQYLGFTAASLHGMKILELGPLEGAQTYQLARLGADNNLAIEANCEAFLKCLIVKEIPHIPRWQFLLGDCLKFLQDTNNRFDLIFCSGVLYHVESPFELIKAISARTDRGPHYYDPSIPTEPQRHAKRVVCDDLELVFYLQECRNTDFGRFWGSTKSTSSWLERRNIERCFV